MYAEDYDERLPPGSYWVDAITPALKKSEATADARPHSADPFKCPAVDSGPAYARNSTSGGIRLADVSAPADYVLVFDALARGADSHGVRLLNGGPELFAKYRHSSSNILFCDGHVKGLNLNVSQLGWAPTDVPKR